MRYKYKREKKDYIREALERVTANRGLVTDIRPEDSFYSEALRKAWFAAKMKGYIRQMNVKETQDYIATQRGVREVLLALIDTTARDETRDADPTYGWGVKDVYRSLERVVDDLHEARTTRYWTLTWVGANYLEQGVREEAVANGKA